MHWFGFKLVPVLALRLRRRAGNMSAEPELRDFLDSASTARFFSESEGELEPIPAVTGQGQCMLLTVHQSITHRDNSPNPQSECFLDCWRKLENPKKKTKKNLTHMGRICTDYRKRQPVWYPPPTLGTTALSPDGTPGISPSVVWTCLIGWWSLRKTTVLK